jgi:hypothetical protein
LRSGWTVSNFRGRAQLHVTARAGDGHRKQLLLPYPWKSDQLKASRDGVVAVENGGNTMAGLAPCKLSWTVSVQGAGRLISNSSPAEPLTAA